MRETTIEKPIKDHPETDNPNEPVWNARLLSGAVILLLLGGIILTLLRNYL